MERTTRSKVMVAVVAAALVVIALLFYMQWNSGIQARVDDQMRNNPTFQTTGALQTRIAVP